MAEIIKFRNKEEEEFWKTLVGNMSTNKTYTSGAKVIEFADYYLSSLRERMPVERVPYNESFPRYKVAERKETGDK